MATYGVNPAAVRRARELVDAKQYVLDSDWGAVQPDAAAQNAFLERHSWEEYAAAGGFETLAGARSSTTGEALRPAAAG
ncbi:hypothetical protein EKO23_17715 [Nocardioides guangzhouensis]|uniref:Uncharacterized protein n=1 Tax=Nocardioides guangzhouensis TaxID=2497878 RepID=A0A4Q4Z8X3_9ACTN|nr:hypothetical protein [Nocardioides guangzhouensis]RYP83915.1 hypothetical protein EKO23_17715 [Nocardioides guangzhouensis]